LIAGANKEADINIVEKLDNKDKDWDNKKINNGLLGKVEDDGGESGGGQTKEDVVDLNENGQSGK
jgi:hypothetical protein